MWEQSHVRREGRKGNMKGRMGREGKGEHEKGKGRDRRAHEIACQTGRVLCTGPSRRHYVDQVPAREGV